MKLPPLNPLKVFHALARTKNIHEAAKALHLSPSAVHKQLHSLQLYLGVELYRRERQGIVLTQVGQRFSETILPALDSIAAITKEVMQESSDNMLRLQTYNAFADKWLMPRLSDFNARHPEISVLLTSSVQDVDFDRDGVDMAIQKGHGHPAGHDFDVLFDDEIEPVCSPAYWRDQVGEDHTLKDWSLARLLVAHYRASDWTQWAQACDRIPSVAQAQSMRFSSSLLAWQAAEEGLGLAMGQNFLLADDLRQQKLMAPFQRSVKTGDAYWLIRPRLQRQSRKVTAFRDWLLEQVQSAQA